MENNFSFKELYDVCLKATYPIEIGGRKILKGENIAVFDKILISNFDEIRTSAQAEGGYDNRGRVFWDNVKEVRINFAQGIFSKQQFALMTNTEMIKPVSSVVTLSQREQRESNEQAEVSLKYSALPDTIFVYDQSGNKISYTVVNEQTLKIDKPYKVVTIDYQFNYSDLNSTLIVGRPLIEGFLALEGRTKFKDDVTGQVHTGIIKIPRLKLMSDLSMRLGQDATPLVGRLDAVALPTGDRNNKVVMELLFLNDDIDSDM